jgi:hypothetical protein
LRPLRPWTPPPLLDAVSLGELRRRATDDFGEAAPWEVLRRRARQTTSGVSWWVLVTLSLVLSLGIAVLMAALIARELDGGRATGSWLLLPAGAGAIAVIGFAFTVRTAIRSRRDRRQRRRRRLFRRVIGWVARGSPATGAPGTAGSGSASGIGGGLAGRFGSTFAGGRRGGSVPGAAALGGMMAVPAMALSSGGTTEVPTDLAGGGGGPGGGAGPGDGQPSPHVPYLAALVAALFLGLLPWPGGDGVPEAGAQLLVPVATPAATPSATPVVLGGIGGPSDLVNPSATPVLYPENIAPLPGGGQQPVSPANGLADPSQPPAAPTPAPVPPVAPPPPPAPTPDPTPLPTRTPLPIHTPEPEPTPAPTPTPTPTPVPPPPEPPPPEPEPPPFEPTPPPDDGTVPPPGGPVPQ